ncbi:Hypothetical predicted protein [Cloeon dipterum]|uniref:Uncharacterized protein n=1 Tax=Cloeon dipterum TaxID=197152 RepID=A0A8S1CVL7_9INSE|nr:Hypothetical predicted protein [Cloeon dipterum]
MRLLLHFSVLTVLCAICCAQTKPPPTTTRTTPKTTTKTTRTTTRTTTKTTTRTTSKTTTKPRVDCALNPWDYMLVNNSCYEPKLSSVFGDNGDGSFDAAFKACGGNDETLYYLTYFKLNEFYDKNNNFNLNNTNQDKRLLAQEKILFCIFQKLGIVDSNKTFTNDDAVTSKAMSASIKKFPYWWSIWNCLHRLCNKLIYINVGWNIRIVIYIRCYIYYMYMDYIGWPILKSRAIPEGLTWR